MKTLSSITLASLTGALVALGTPGLAQATDPDKPSVAARPASAADLRDLTEGEIKKVDKDNKKLTIKHGDIKSLDMPGMTMVFKVKDPGMIDSVKVGDKVRFAVENLPTGLVVTEMVLAGK